MDFPKQKVKTLVASIEPYDSLEAEHTKDVINWIDSGKPIFRISKPDNPPKHLVSYFVLFDETHQSLMLIDHIKARLWLPAGGHVEVDEDPKDTVIREAMEELKIQADLSTKLGDKPFFVTVTETKNADIHTDVSLWYVIKGDVNKKLDFDKREMNSYRWFSIDEVLSEDIKNLDPHMHRFTRKLKESLSL
jgi:8-oxo-dGTP pyrophosphatase MutT (NUDIX family)